MLDTNLMLRLTTDTAMLLAASPISGATKDYGSGDVLPFTYILNVIAQAGTTPTLDVKIQESDDGTTWRDFLAFKQVTTALGQTFVTGQSDARYRRYYATLVGTGASYTASIGPDMAGIYTQY
jgi:hypothetical protein